MHVITRANSIFPWQLLRFNTGNLRCGYTCMHAPGKLQFHFDPVTGGLMSKTSRLLILYDVMTYLTRYVVANKNLCVHTQHTHMLNILRVYGKIYLNVCFMFVLFYNYFESLSLLLRKDHGLHHMFSWYCAQTHLGHSNLSLKLRTDTTQPNQVKF